MARVLLLFLVLALMPIKPYAQEADAPFENITTKDGLSQNTVTCMLQDHQGFLWFGTEDGLNRYDGYQFVVYRHDPENAYSLSDSNIYSLYEDRSGTIWVGTTTGGLNRFDRATGRFTHYKHKAVPPGAKGPFDGPSGNHVSSIIEDHAGNLWMSVAGSGLNRMNRQTGKFTYYQHKPGDPYGLSTNSVLGVHADRTGLLWVGTTRGLHKLDPVTGRFTPYGDTTSRPANTVYSIHEDRDGLLWLGGLAGTLTRFDPGNGAFTRYNNVSKGTRSVDNNLVMSICEDDRGDLWIATLGNGINRFNKQTGSFTAYKHQPANPQSLVTDNIVSIGFDKSGILWAGTYGQGIAKLGWLTGRFTHLRHQPGNPNSLASNYITPVLEDSAGALWIGTVDQGLHRLDPASGRLAHYRREAGKPGSLASNAVFSLCADRQGTLWVGTSNGLSGLDPRTGRTRLYQHNPADSTTLLNDFVSALYEDRQGNFWVGARGLSKLDRRTGKFTRYPYRRATGSPEPVLVECISEDRAGTLWVGSEAGLDQFDRRTGRYSAYRPANATHAKLLSEPVTCLYEDQAGTLWVGTVAGLCKLNRAAGTVKLYRKKDGLPSNRILGVLEDDGGRLWLSTPEGLSKFDPVRETFRNYNAADGLQSNEFKQYAFCKRKNGDLVFGGVNGLNIFNPDSLRDNRHVPPVRLTDFQVFNKSVRVNPEGNCGADGFVLPRAVNEVEVIELPYCYNVFSFQFAALDYTRPERNQYAYFMEGFDQDWTYPGNRRFVTYTNLHPGAYTFRVKGSNNDGVWSREGKAIRIVILPPRWLTWWAFAGYVLAVAALLYGVYRYLISRERLRNELQLERLESDKLQEMDQVKTRFFTNISHEFRTPLTLILGPLESRLALAPDHYPYHKEDQRMHSSAQRLLQLINQLLDISKLEAGRVKLQAAETDLARYVQAIVSSFASLAETRRITLGFHADPESIPAYADRDKLEKIVSNLLSNAFKFTPEGGRIDVRVSVTGGGPYGAAQIAVHDSGIGIPPDRLGRIFDRFYQVDGSHTREQEGTGIGLALTKELITLHRGSITVRSEEGQGTCFTVRLLLGNAHLKADEIIAVTGTGDVRPEAPSPFPEETVPGPAGPEAEAHDNRPLVLVVEDNASVRRYILDHFGGHYRMMEARDGQAGLERAIEQVPDLVISDWMMPRMDGAELCRRLKTDERTSHIPVILLTARASGESRVEGLETGADDYVTKPFSPRELQVRAKNLIEGRQRLRERFGREVKLQPGDVAVTPADEQFLNRAVAVVEQHLSDPDFSLEQFESAMTMSRLQLYRKLKSLTNHAPGEFIRTMRLKKAAQLLDKRAGSITEITYEVGFNNLSYFAKCFREYHGVTPSEYLRQQAGVPS